MLLIIDIIGEHQVSVVRASAAPASFMQARAYIHARPCVYTYT